MRVRFYRPKPTDEDTMVTPYRTMERGERWALVSRRRSDGIVEFGQIRTESEAVERSGLRRLVHLARRS